MKKKILFAVFFATIMLMMPCVSAVKTPTLIDEEDNVGGWVTNTMDYVSAIFADVQFIVANFGIGQDLFNVIRDTFELIKNLRDAERFLELVNVIINDFIPWVQEFISVAQRLIGLVQVVNDLMIRVPEFIDYLNSAPWSAPVIIRGLISNSDGPLQANVVCNEASEDTESDGVYNLEVESSQDYLPSSYSVTASAEDYSSDTKSTLVFPDGVVTVDFVLEVDDDADSIYKCNNLIPTLFNGRFNRVLQIFFILNILKR